MYRYTERLVVDPTIARLRTKFVRSSNNPQRVLDNMIQRLANYEDTGLLPEEVMFFVKDVAVQFGHKVVYDGRLYISTEGHSLLERAFEILGWDDPHPFPEGECRMEGCHEYATCAVPTENGYMFVCVKCYRTIEARKILDAEKDATNDGKADCI